MTIEEAQTKWCCTHELEKCNANNCMAWRWHHEATSMVIGETVGGEKLFTNGERIMSETDGYCGLAGKEGAE